MIGFLGFLLYNSGDVEAKFIKPAGSTFFVRDSKITNTYNFTFLNKSNREEIITIKVLEPNHGEVTLSQSNKIKIKKGDMTKGTINISFPEKEIKLSKQNISIGIYNEKGELLDTFKTYFEGPFKLQF